MMRIIPLKFHILSRQNGAVTVMVALLMVIFLSIAAFAIDFGYTYVIMNELQNAADAAALAGASVLISDNVDCLSSGSPYSCCAGAGTGSCDPNVIDNNNVAQTAQSVAARNKSSDGSVPTSTIEIGHYAFAASWGTPGVFTATTAYTQMTGLQGLSFSALNDSTSYINAVRATVSRANVPRFFSRIWSASPLAVTVQATAYVGTSGTANSGALFPQVISSDVANLACSYNSAGSQIYLGSSYHYPTNQAGQWTSFQTGDNDVPTVNGFIHDGNPTTLNIGDNIWIEPGTKTSIYNHLTNNLPAGVTLPYTVTMAVVQDITTHASVPIIGFICFTITDVQGGSGKYIKGYFPDSCSNGRAEGVGPAYGVHSPPVLVK